MRLEHAMKGWGTDSIVLVRLLSGLDGGMMAEVCEIYEVRHNHCRRYHRYTMLTRRRDDGGDRLDLRGAS